MEVTLIQVMENLETQSTSHESGSSPAAKIEQYCPDFPSALESSHPQRMSLPNRHRIIVAVELLVSCLRSANVHTWLLIFILFPTAFISNDEQNLIYIVLFLKRQKRIENFNTKEQEWWTYEIWSFLFLKSVICLFCNRKGRNQYAETDILVPYLESLKQNSYFRCTFFIVMMSNCISFLSFVLLSWSN